MSVFIRRDRKKVKTEEIPRRKEGVEEKKETHKKKKRKRGEDTR